MQNLSSQAEAAASALSRISDLEAAIMARYQQAFQAGTQTQQAAEQVASGLRAVAQAEQDFLTRIRVTQGLVEQRGLPHRLEGFPVTVFGPSDPNRGRTENEVQRALEVFRSQRQSLEARLPAPPVTHSATLPALPAAPLALQASALTEQLRTAPLPLPEPPPVSASERAFREKMGQERADVERGRLRNVPPPPNPAVPTAPAPDYLQRLQQVATERQQPLHLPGHGLILPEPVPPPPAPLPPSPLAARLQGSQRQAPVVPTQPTPPPVALPQPELSGLAARMLQTAPQATPALPGGLAARMMALAPPVATLPEAIPVAPSAGASPLAARVGGQLQELQRRMRQAENEDLARQAQEALQRAEEEERQDRQHVNRVQYGRMETPLARAAYEGRVRNEMRERTAGYQQETLGSRIEARTLGGPESLALSRAQVEAQAQAQTNQMRQQAQVTQAQAAFARTPEGQAQFRMQQQARTDTLQAQELRQRAESVAQYGRLGAALREASDRVGHFGNRVLEVGSSVGRIVGGVSALGAAASPQAAATLRGSMTLARARLGREFLPAMDLESYVLQRGSELYRRAADSSPVARTALATATGAAQGALIGAAIPIPGATIAGGVIGGTIGFVSSLSERRKDILQSYEGLPAGGYTTGPQFYEKLQTAGLNMSPLDTEVLAEQLRNSTGLLEKIERNTSGMANQVPAWR